ncbi:MAG: hypothetical protein Q9160_002423 [Pyrenula sp. 1 TL-2023]
MASTFRVYKIQRTLALKDPDFPYSRYHTCIFIETTPEDGSGRVHEVNGDMVTGMSYRAFASPPPRDSEGFHASHYLGTVEAARYPAAVDDVLGTVLPPLQQKVFSPSKRAYVRCKQDGSQYGPGESVPALVKCTEWTEGRAIPALMRAGVIRAGEGNGI